MMTLLHRVEILDTVELLRQFARFSCIQLYKPARAHAKRKSFYLVASNVQVEHADAMEAQEGWKRTWKIATFSGEEEFGKLVHRHVS
jgi:hypothetical protein